MEFPDRKGPLEEGDTLTSPGRVPEVVISEGVDLCPVSLERRDVVRHCPCSLRAADVALNHYPSWSFRCLGHRSDYTSRRPLKTLLVSEHLLWQLPFLLVFVED